MSREYYKENIRFLTEWLRVLLAVSILIASGVASLMLKDNDKAGGFERIFFIVGILSIIVLIGIIVKLNKNINRNINKLKNV